MAGPEGQTGPQRPWWEKRIQAGNLGWKSLVFPSVKIEAQGPEAYTLHSQGRGLRFDLWSGN